MYDGNNTKILAMNDENLNSAIKCILRAQKVNGGSRYNGILILQKDKFIYKRILEWRKNMVLDEYIFI